MNSLFSLMCVDENDATAGWIRDSFPIIQKVMLVVLLILSIAMIILVVMQKSNENGVSAINGQTDTFYNRNKKTTLQGKIKNITIVVAVLMMVLCILFMISMQLWNPYGNA